MRVSVCVCVCASASEIMRASVEKNFLNFDLFDAQYCILIMFEQ